MNGEGKRYGQLMRRKTRTKYREIIAYDLETTPIKKGTPQPLYITAYGKDLFLSSKVENIHHLKALIIHHLLTDENKGKIFVAWNGNKFDAYFVAQALLTVEPDYCLRPYLTRSNALRGLGVIEFPDWDKDVWDTTGYTQPPDWQFLDGMAMTGVHTKLRNFLNTYAPEYAKLDIGLDKGKKFDPDNPKHIEYAERDSEGLYHTMVKCNDIINQATDLHLTPTIGNLGIKYFQRKIPKGIKVYRPPFDALEVIEDHALRGGFCFLAYKYKGPIWKYDINQAYAAAMRDASLPAGRCMDRFGYTNELPGIYKIKGSHPNPLPIPLYHKPIHLEGAPQWSIGEFEDTWLTSIEIDQLIEEGWDLDLEDCEGFVWQYSFNMSELVDELEKLRLTDPDGPSGPIGTMAKALGNNSYGKLAERLDGIDYLFATEQPPGFVLAEVENPDREFLWCRVGEPNIRIYHRPQISAFITAHVRMQVRKAALLGGPDWIYADTDCVAYRRPIDTLDIHPTRYGAWKLEVDGLPYVFNAKKVYASLDGKHIYAKGMHKAGLTLDHMIEWYKGNPPKQGQLQRRGILHVLSGFDMFVNVMKTGQIK